MRLLNTRTGEFHWIERPAETRYSILSHVWAKSPDDPPEQSYQDVLAIQAQVKSERAQNPNLPEDEVLSRLSPKIRMCCARAREDGIDFAWVDACCIDKTSSAELTEAINSMYAWYATSTVCYAFLHDVPSSEDPYGIQSRFRLSVWFTRGWTLQELVAPATVLFFSSDWILIGGKHGLAAVIEDITGIDVDILAHHQPLNSVSVARRMYWASKRVTTRKEDEAYSLMGIFGVKMPTIYGEGDGAFFRLQEEILKSVSDQSIFAWDLDRTVGLTAESTASAQLLLASSPAAFSHSGSVKSAPRLFPNFPSHPVYSTTPHGIRTRLPYYPLNEVIHDSIGFDVGESNIPLPHPKPFRSELYYLIPLECTDGKDYILALVLKDRSIAVSGVHRCDIELLYMPFVKSASDEMHISESHVLKTPGEMPCRVLRLKWRTLKQPYHPSEFYIAHRPSLLTPQAIPPQVHAIWSHHDNTTFLVIGADANTIPDITENPPSRRHFKLINTNVTLAPFPQLFSQVTCSIPGRLVPTQFLKKNYLFKLGSDNLRVSLASGPSSSSNGTGNPRDYRCAMISDRAMDVTAREPESSFLVAFKTCAERTLYALSILYTMVPSSPQAPHGSQESTKLTPKMTSRSQIDWVTRQDQVRCLNPYTMICHLPLHPDPNPHYGSPSGDREPTPRSLDHPPYIRVTARCDSLGTSQFPAMVALSVERVDTLPVTPPMAVTTHCDTLSASTAIALSSQPNTSPIQLESRAASARIHAYVVRHRVQQRCASKRRCIRRGIPLCFMILVAAAVIITMALEQNSEHRLDSAIVNSLETLVAQSTHHSNQTL